jgi:hypothetical protein
MKPEPANAEGPTLLTADLVRPVFRKDGMRIPRLRADALTRVHQLAEQMLALALPCVGETRMALDEALAIEVPQKERLIWMGLQKLVLDRCTFAISGDVEPSELRRQIFSRAALLRRQGHFDEDSRRLLLEQVASERSMSVPDIEFSLFADLKPAQRLEKLELTSADELVSRYELGRAQSVLLKAQRVEVSFRPSSPEQARRAFQKLKFLQLLFGVERRDDHVIVQIEGPLSLFRATTRYGLKLAMALPILATLPECQLRADVMWGKSRTQRVFRWESCELASLPPLAPPRARPEIERLQADFQKHAKDWRVAPSDSILHAPGQGVCIPDLAFTHVKSAMCIHLELMGFWSREAIWQRIDWARSGKLPRVLFVYSDKLRVSEAALESASHAALLSFKGVISADKVRAKLDAQIENQLNQF